MPCKTQNMEFRELRVKRIRKTWKQHLATPRGLVVKIATHSGAAALRRHQLLLIQDCEKPGKTWIGQNTLGARVWQCNCLTPSRYEKQTRTSRPQPFIRQLSDSSLRQRNNFSSLSRQILGASTKHSFVLHSAADVGCVGGGTERTTVGCQYPVSRIVIATVSLRRLGRREKRLGRKRHDLLFFLHHGYAAQSQRRITTDLCRMGTDSRNGRHQFRQDDPVAGA